MIIDRGQEENCKSSIEGMIGRERGEHRKGQRESEKERERNGQREGGGESDENKQEKQSILAFYSSHAEHLNSCLQ